MRAKLRIGFIQTNRNPDNSISSQNLTMFAVAANKYPSDGSDENNTFAKYSPSAEFRICINNPALFDKFKQGECYYVDFTKAPD